MKDSDTNLKYVRQGEMLANKVRKKYRHLKKRYARQGLEIFRLYDWDIPEIRAVVDWYAGHLVIGEYTRTQSTKQWLPLMGQYVAKALEIPESNLHLKTRKSGVKDGRRYERLDHTNKKIPMQERDLKFYINLDDYVDTGLFSDHRNTRQMVRQMAAGKSVLNLYCYTGAFTCYAAKGDAKRTVSVDRSQTAIEWVRQNLDLNRLLDKKHTLIQRDTIDFLKKAGENFSDFDIAVVDPPSYSTTRNQNEHFDIARDHPQVLNLVIKRMKPDGVIFFSTNHQNFDMKSDRLNAGSIEEITHKTIPEDYQNKRKKIHRCWEIRP